MTHGRVYFLSPAPATCRLQVYRTKSPGELYNHLTLEVSTFVCLACFFFFLGGVLMVGLKLRAFLLESHLQPFFALVMLEIRSHFLPRLAWTLVLLFYAFLHS
jgi:hypothetical protein